MVEKGQWAVLPYSVARTLPGLRLSPPGVKEERDRRPRWLGDYSFFKTNADTLTGACTSAMQYGRTLDRVLREIVFADPALGPVYLIKMDVSDGFYRIGLRAEDAPKLGLIFPGDSDGDPLVAIPLTLPMGWKNSPPIFCTATETVADLANEALRTHIPSRPHKLDARAENIVPAPAPGEQKCFKDLGRDPYLQRKNAPLLAYVDVFVDDFLGLAQGPRHRRRHVRRTLFHALDKVFRPLDGQDAKQRKEVLSLKKLDAGDCSWSTCQVLLGWIVDTINMTITLPPHRVERLHEILSAIPRSQRRISVDKWHRVLGELRSMTLALPGARGLFSQMQEALRHVKGKRVALSKGVHEALADFRWLASDLAQRPTRLYELVPLRPTVDGYHDASGYMCGGVVLPGPTAVPRTLPPQPSAARPAQGEPAAHPIVWRASFPPDIVQALVSWTNPTGTVNNSDLELAGGIIHHDCVAQCFDVRERTVLSRTDNTAGLWWQRKGSATCTSAPALLLRLQAMHQRYHRYVPRHDFIAGKDNIISDRPSRSSDLTDNQLLAYLELNFPQSQPWRLWTPPTKLISGIASALRRRTSARDSLLAAPSPPMAIGQPGHTFVPRWPSTPYSPLTKTLSPSLMRLPGTTALAPSPPPIVKYDPERLRMPYGQLGRRSRHWGPETLG